MSPLYKNENEALPTKSDYLPLWVQHPRKLMIFLCFPICFIVCISERRSSNSFSVASAKVETMKHSKQIETLDLVRNHNLIKITGLDASL